jgi:hypothetical protein
VPKQKNKTSVEIHLGSQGSTNQTGSLEEYQTKVSKSHNQHVRPEIYEPGKANTTESK